MTGVDLPCQDIDCKFNVPVPARRDPQARAQWSVRGPLRASPRLGGFASNPRCLPSFVGDGAEQAHAFLTRDDRAPCVVPEVAEQGTAPVLAVQETLESGESMSCRMLPQPIDRYQPPDGQNVDGAIFAFANGTNPEVGVILECDGVQWSYGLVRLSSAEMTVTLDETQVASFPTVASVDQPRGSYVARLRPVELPE